MSPTEDLTGKVAVITGASSGIGRALAHQLHALGVKLALGSRKPSDLGLSDVVAQACDVRDRGQVGDLVDAAVQRFGRLDILVANAGVGHYADFLETPDEHVTEMIETNVLGTIHLYRAGLPHLRASGSAGDLITVASEAGRRGFAGEAVYSASKFAQVGLTRALDNELRGAGIRCTNICPGGVATEFAMADGRGRTPDSPSVQQMMAAEDVADLIVYALTRPRGMRLLEVALRPMSEASSG
jgi:meso-butanediol dehydrogenase / (S,S)-butanediol dehydrogenase / diacetyl reductase